jgi:hypothetical protein
VAPDAGTCWARLLGKILFNSLALIGRKLPRGGVAKGVQ